MKDILSILLYQTLLILVLKHITICLANDPSESYDLDRSSYEERNRNNRRGYGEPDNISRANQIYEAAYADRARQLREQNYIGRAGESKFTKPENLRQPLNLDSEYNLRSAYTTNRGYGITRNGDSSENIDIASAGTIEGDASNVSVIPESSHANNTMSSSRIVKPIADSCTCQGTGASDEVNFLCFSSKDGSKSFSIKSKGITKFNLEDIIKAYKFYYDNIIVHNYNFEHIINGESNFQHDSDNTFNFNMSKYKIDGFHEGNFNIEAENKFDINEIKNGGNKIKVNTFDKYDINTFKKDSNKFNFDVTSDVQNIDIHKYFNDNNKFNTQFDKNVNGNFNLETNAKIQAFKKIQSMTDYNKNSKFNFDNDLNVNQYSFNSDMQDDAQAEIEAHALAQAKLIVKAEAILEAQAKAQSVIQNQIFAQAQAEAQAQAMIQADSHFKTQTQGQTQAQAQAQAHSQAQAQAQVQAQAQAQAQAHAQAQAQIHAQVQAQAHGNAQAYNQGQINSQAQGLSYSDLNNNFPPNKGFSFGVGVENTLFGNGGFNVGLNPSFGKKIGGSIGKAFSGIWTSGNGGTGAPIGGRLPLAGPAAVGDDGMGASAVVGTAFTGDEFNYPDGLYDDNRDDGSTSVGYPGVIAYPARIDSPITGNRLYGDGHSQQDLGFTPYGGSGYHRYT